ncbi:hypothetical protein LSH36_401g00069 [Paralvinella palmiformis]|uniref:Dyp-type peroxidase C-terminal domain-containing protein n=1 Tax=Paralvinella palmiformis TaxID=53620 RepID=A0AAD9JCA7_9ANNE|nr:hypothetical protein LSH36_401g00069 [Paralvinella palmiformis]
MMSFRMATSRLLGMRGTAAGVASRCYYHARQTARGHSKVRPLLLGLMTVGGTYGVYRVYNNNRSTLTGLVRPRTVSAATQPESQDSVYSQGKCHALYLWIHLKPKADAKLCAKVVADIDSHVDAVSPLDLRDEDDEIWAGVGFGADFYGKIGGQSVMDYKYPRRKGALGELPSSGGDLFIHAKCNTYSKLFELCQRIIRELPPDSVDKFEDVYSFVYRNGRDLSGFIDGTENAADEEERREIAVEKETGASYVITQVWVHKLDVINKEEDGTMEKWIGRTRDDSIELNKKPVTSHVARMTGGDNFQQRKRYQIVRQSMPYGNLHDKAGLFFIAYAASPEKFEYMLDRMVGADVDKECDDIMRLTKCVKGTYWYFPGKEQLKKLAS